MEKLTPFAGRATSPERGSRTPHLNPLPKSAACYFFFLGFLVSFLGLLSLAMVILPYA
jgi:hypothetical protein